MRPGATNELTQIDAVTTQHAKRWALVALRAEEPVGVEPLKKLARHAAAGFPIALPCPLVA